ncbi:hypothetical protein Nepgr_019895 [Nepenthes gracilis]|uniref:Uncharacterized protein n=1 Tax=Nepenthes gracilis TaxID=150966 RepID=A0AAD3SW18_NEPGR|nr:hypothetical protein Nepgr_019895 [Nepenthes gracilis]
MRSSFDSGILSLYLAKNRALQRNGGYRDRTSCLEGIPGTAVEGFEPYVDRGGKRGPAAIDESQAKAPAAVFRLHFPV